MLVATVALSATGGHGDLNGFSPYLRFESIGGADGVAARQQSAARAHGDTAVAVELAGGDRDVGLAAFS